jgi:hypothetical protein
MVSKKTQSLLMSIALVVFILGFGFIVYKQMAPGASGTIGVVVPTPAPGQGNAHGGSEIGCTQVPSSAQNMQIAVRDVALQGTAITTTQTDVYLGTTEIKADLAEATNQATSYGTTYGLFTTKSGYFSAWNQFTSPCMNAAPVAVVDLSNVDGSAAITVVNDNGITANTAAANQTIGAGGGVTSYLTIKGGEANAYLSDPTCDKFTVVLVYTNVSKIDTGVSTIRGCTEIGMVKKYAGVGHQAFLCNGNTFDFSKKNLEVYTKAIAGLTPGVADDVTVRIMPMGNVQHSVNGKVLTCVAENDVGTAVSTVVSGTIHIN